MGRQWIRHISKTWIFREKKLAEITYIQLLRNRWHHYNTFQPRRAVILILLPAVGTEVFYQGLIPS